MMKKFGQFIISLVQPRKLAKYRNMHILLSLLIFLVGMFVALGSQYMMSEKFVIKEMERYEYDDTLQTLYTNKDTGQPDTLNGLMFRNLQTINFTSDTNVSVDEKDNAAQLTSEVLVESFTTADNSPFNVYIYFDPKLEYITNENGDYYVPSKDNILLDYYNKKKNSTESSYFFYFGKDYVYYIKSNQLITMHLDCIPQNDSDIIKYLKSIGQIHSFSETSYETTVDQALAYLRRVTFVSSAYTVDNTDELGFVNEMFKLFNINEPGIKYVENADNSVPYHLYSTSYLETKGIYHKVMLDTSKADQGFYLDFTLVIDQNLNNRSSGNTFLEHFDYEGYTKQKRTPNTTYILCVFGFDRLFFIYDLGQDKDNNYNPFDYSNGSIFEVTNAGNRKYYLPKDESEISYNMYGDVDTSKWTLECGQDDYTKVGNVDYKAVDRHNKDFFSAVYTKHSRSYLYSDVVGNGFDNKTISKTTRIDDMLQKIVDRMVAINAANYELVYALMAFAAIILFPLVLMLIVWVMSKKLFMKRLRQYYAIAALCYGASSILSFIAGFFLPFDKYALFLMFFQAWWFIFVTYRINTDPKYNNENYDPNDDDNDKKEQKKELEFKKIKDADKVKASSIG